MSIKLKRLNMNNAVMVKQNEAGHKEMERQHNELYETIGLKYRPFVRKGCDENGYSSFQLHTLMNTFGHMVTLGSKLPFDDCSIFIPEVFLNDTEEGK